MSDEIPTPRTNAQEIAGYGERVVYAEFARGLEIELSQSAKSNLELRAFIQELESHQQGMANELASAKDIIQELHRRNFNLKTEAL